jgi:hypothetical protein
MRELVEELGFNAGQVFWYLRVAVTGQKSARPSSRVWKYIWKVEGSPTARTCYCDVEGYASSGRIVYGLVVRIRLWSVTMNLPAKKPPKPWTNVLSGVKIMTS